MATNEDLQKALDLGLVTPAQIQGLLYNSENENIAEALENLISDQIESGQQCVGDHCSL